MLPPCGPGTVAGPETFQYLNGLLPRKRMSQVETNHIQQNYYVFRFPSHYDVFIISKLLAIFLYHVLIIITFIFMIHPHPYHFFLIYTICDYYHCSEPSGSPGSGFTVDDQAKQMLNFFLKRTLSFSVRGTLFILYSFFIHLFSGNTFMLFVCTFKCYISFEVLHSQLKVFPPY